MPATITAPSYRVGVDIGGTFTDVVVATSDGGRGVRKLLSTPADFGRAVVSGVRAALADSAPRRAHAPKSCTQRPWSPTPFSSARAPAPP